jgi:hypothetical protein
MRASSSRSNLAWAQVRKTGPGKNGAYPLTCNHCNLAFKGNLSRVLTLFTNERLLRQMNKADREEAFLPWDDPSDDEAEEGSAEEVPDNEVSDGELLE